MKRISLKLLFFISAVAVFSFQANAQSDEEAIKTTITTMFDGMRAGDSTKVHSVFSDDVIMKTIGTDRATGKKVVRESPLQGFLNAVGTPHDEIWDEKVKSFEIKIDGPMATAWVPYEFYRGDNFSHCGVNSFQLFKADRTWKIIYLIDTRKRTGCK